MERINIQTEISIRGIGISLVNNFQSKEVIYMAISSSGVVWEQRHRNRFRPMAVKMVEACEEAYQEWANNGKPNQSVHVHDVDLDFTNMILRKKGGKRTEWKIRRSFLEGFWLQHSQSDHQTRLHLKINHIQIDNQVHSINESLRKHNRQFSFPHAYSHACSPLCRLLAPLSQTKVGSSHRVIEKHLTNS